jgi:hypothetical protein
MITLARALSAALLLCLLFPSPFLRSDAIVITKAMTAPTVAEIFVDEDAVRVELEIGVVDLPAFRNLMSDELYERLGFDPKPLEQRLPRFFGEDLVIRPDGSGPLPGFVEELTPRWRVVRDEVTGEPLPAAEDRGEPVVFAKLRYPLRGRPAGLTLVPPRTEVGTNPASIGFVTYHRGLPVNDFRYLGRPERVELDWADPWYSQFENRNLRRQFYGPISVFLYIEPFEVRKEIVFRPKDLQQWVDLGLEGREIIPAAEQEEIRRRAAEFMASHGSVTIDGEPVEGILDRAHFIFRNLRTSGVIDPPRDLDVVSATMGAIFVYPVEGLPSDVKLEWDLFAPRIEAIPSSSTDEAGSLPYVLTPSDNVLHWQNFLINPSDPTRMVEIQAPPSGRDVLGLLGLLIGVVGLVWVGARHGQSTVRGRRPPVLAALVAIVSIVLVASSFQRATGSVRVSDDDALEVVAALLENTYRAFDFREEETIYDILERSAAGELLTDIYLETRQSLELENQGGARVKVKEIEVLSADTDPLRDGVGFTTLARWNVSGSVGHWGHIHQRINQYAARFTVQAVDGRWKFTALELLQEERL